MRAAIQTANQEKGRNTIDFAIPGVGPHRITISEPLPSISDLTGPLTIDGYSQPGAAVNTAAAGSNAALMIEIESQAVGAALRIASPENVIRGLSIFNGQDKILIVGENAVGNRILGNFLGTDAAGTFAQSSLWVGLMIERGASQNKVGTPAHADRNLISRNRPIGI
ncbi:MAG: hypothetical protein AAGE98_11930, partial [Actinomycetota bacterium]